MMLCGYVTCMMLVTVKIENLKSQFKSEKESIKSYLGHSDILVDLEAEAGF